MLEGSNRSVCQTAENSRKFYIHGAWVEPGHPQLFDVINPATELTAGQISFGTGADVERAVAAARRAFHIYSEATRDERVALLLRILEVKAVLGRRST